jgi:glycosyltransferase involved in cell wall biosynthesis
MKVCLVLVTHNRLPYTQKCLDYLLSDKESDFDLHIWDNASTDETRGYLKDGISDPRIKEVILHEGNPGPTFAMNQIWTKTKADLVGKVDNDCLVSPGWVKTLSEAHQDIKKLGAVACWHFRPEDFDESVATEKVERHHGHRIFRHPWICGSGFLLKKETYTKIGPSLQGDRSYGLTTYFLDIARAGYINGWYYPFILQEHMDDPLSPHCAFRDDESMQALTEITYTMRTHGIKTYAQRLERRVQVLHGLNYGPSDVKYYIGWREKLRKLKRFLKRSDLRRAELSRGLIR